MHDDGYNTMRHASDIMPMLHKGSICTKVDVRRCITIQCQLAIDGKYKSRLSPICPTVIRDTDYP